MTVVVLPILRDVSKSSVELKSIEFDSDKSRVAKKMEDHSHLVEFSKHRPPSKSWEFLNDYISQSQNRFERMKDRLSKATTLKLAEEAQAAKKLADAEYKARMDAEAKKKAAESLEAQYERPQSKAQFDAYNLASKDHFSLSSMFENAQDSASKTLRMKLKMNINRRIGQINDSLQQVRSIVADLTSLCYESRSVSKHAFSYSLVLLASKFLAQAENQVSLHAPSAFPLAAVAVEISTTFPEFPAVLMTSLSNKCMFAVPKYSKRKASDPEYKKECGYLVIDNVVKETDTAFFERMSGLISFFGAIVQSNTLSGKPNVLGINLGWTWLAAILNMPPRPITANILFAFLEQASYVMYKKYGEAFGKLIKFILEKYLPMIPSSCIAAKTRVELLCNELLKAGPNSIKEPVGRRIAP